METPSVKRRLTCILAADAVGYSSHMSADEEGTVKVLAAHRAVIDGIIAFHDGRIVGTAGDSVLAEFSSAVSAVRCASEIQEAIKTRNDALPESQRLLFRVGVNLGDVVVRDHDLLGDGVNIASRLETLAEPGGICISSSVYEQITGKLNLGFLDIGEQTLKNIGRPVRVYRVGGAQPPTVAGVVAPQQRSSHPVATVTLSALAAVILAGALAWSQGWLHLGAAPPAPPTNAASGASQVPAPASPAPQGSQTVTAAAGNVAPALTPSNPPATPPAASPGSPLVQPVAPPAGGGNPLPAAQAPAAKAKPAAASRPEPAAKGVAPAPAPAPATATAPAAATTAQPAKPDSTAPTPSAVPMPATPASPAPEPAAPRAAAGTDRFDGSWLVRIRCDAGPGGAEPYELAVNATVKQGWLRAERNGDSDVNTLLMEGLIGDDGRATLKAQGQTGDPRYAMHRVRPGSRYGYEVEARFEGNSGTGVRHGRRRCDLQFHRQ